MFAVIGFNENLAFAYDDLYNMVLVSISTLKSVIQPRESSGEGINRVKWLED